MKKLMKLIKVPMVAFLAAILATLPAYGATISTNIAAAGTNNIIASAGSITALTFSGTAATVKVRLLDSSSSAQTYVIGAYTNYSVNVFTNTYTYVDLLGATNTNSFKYWTNVPTTVAQSTNNYRVIGDFSVPSGETVTVQYDTANPFFRGVTVTNSGAVNVTVNYLPWR